MIYLHKLTINDMNNDESQQQGNWTSLFLLIFGYIYMAAEIAFTIYIGYKVWVFFDV